MQLNQISLECFAGRLPFPLLYFAHECSRCIVMFYVSGGLSAAGNLAGSSFDGEDWVRVSHQIPTVAS